MSVEGHDGILVIRKNPNCRGWNGIHYKEGLSGGNVGAKALSMNVATIPPGGVAAAHIHVGFEVMLDILEGRVRHEYGDGLKQVVENTAGDFIFIEPGAPPPVRPVAHIVFGTNASTRRGFSTRMVCSVASPTPACRSRGTIVVMIMSIPAPPFFRRYFSLAKSDDRQIRSS